MDKIQLGALLVAKHGWEKWVRGFMAAKCDGTNVSFACMKVMVFRENEQGLLFVEGRTIIDKWEQVLGGDVDTYQITYLMNHLRDGPTSLADSSLPHSFQGCTMDQRCTQPGTESAYMLVEGEQSKMLVLAGKINMWFLCCILREGTLCYLYFYQVESLIYTICYRPNCVPVTTPPIPNPYVEAVSPNTVVFENSDFQEVIKFKWDHSGGALIQ